jgi:hypothetical protein
LELSKGGDDRTAGASGFQLDTALEFLGEGYQDGGDGRLFNGSLQVRMTDEHIANPEQMPHLNFEE